MFLCSNFNSNLISGFPKNATLSNGVFQQVIQEYLSNSRAGKTSAKPQLRCLHCTVIVVIVTNSSHRNIVACSHLWHNLGRQQDYEWRVCLHICNISSVRKSFQPCSQTVYCETSQSLCTDICHFHAYENELRFDMN